MFDASVEGDVDALASLLLEMHREAIRSGNDALIRASETIQSNELTTAGAALLEIYELCGIFGESTIDDINADPNILTFAEGTLNANQGDQASSRQLLSEVDDFYVQFEFHVPPSVTWDVAIEVGGSADGYHIVIDSGGIATLQAKAGGRQFAAVSELMVSALHGRSTPNTLTTSIIAGRAMLFLNGLYAAHFNVPVDTPTGPVTLVAGLTNDSTYDFEYFNLNAFEVSDMNDPDSGSIDPLPGEIATLTYELHPFAQGNVRHIGASLSPRAGASPWSNGFIFLDSPGSALVLTVDNTFYWWLHYIENGEWYELASGRDTTIDIHTPISNKIELKLDVQIEFCLLIAGFVNDTLIVDVSFCQGETNLRNWSEDSSDRFEFIPASITGNVGVIANIFEGDAFASAFYNDFVIKGIGKYE